jgi:nuclear transport factor 2 (NTF2) superfamily protein
MQTASLTPPFTLVTAIKKVRFAENMWNTCDPHKVCLGYTEDCYWRNRAEFINGRQAIIDFLARKWSRELDYRLVKELWAHDENRIAVRFAYEWHDDSGNWFRSYGNENWEFESSGLMKRRLASINDVRITEAERLFHWDRKNTRPDDHRSLSELGL